MGNVLKLLYLNVLYPDRYYYVGWNGKVVYSFSTGSQFFWGNKEGIVDALLREVVDESED